MKVRSGRAAGTTGSRRPALLSSTPSRACAHRRPTAITGYYGQNLPCPGFGRESGFIACAAVIVLLSALLPLTFKRKDWL